MALVTCNSCRGVGKIVGMGYITRTCPECEGEGEVSNVVKLDLDVVAPRTRAKRVSREVNDERSMSRVVTSEAVVGV